MTDRPDRVDRFFHLREALLDTPAKRRAYRDFADFHHGVDLIARTLPQFVELMHAEAAANEQRRQAAVRLAETTTQRFVIGRCGAVYARNGADHTCVLPDFHPGLHSNMADPGSPWSVLSDPAEHQP